MLLVNYWDSVIATMPICPNGMLSDISVKLEPPKKVVARHIEDHLHNRQSEPHAHAIGKCNDIMIVQAIFLIVFPSSCTGFDLYFASSS
jgi:hypothetical protein